MTVENWITMFTELNGYAVHICIFDLRVGKCVWNSAKCEEEEMDLIAEVEDGDYGAYELLSVDLYRDCDDTICLDLNIETEEEDDE